MNDEILVYLQIYSRLNDCLNGRNFILVSSNKAISIIKGYIFFLDKSAHISALI